MLNHLADTAQRLIFACHGFTHNSYMLWRFEQVSSRALRRICATAYHEPEFSSMFHSFARRFLGVFLPIFALFPQLAQGSEPGLTQYGLQTYSDLAYSDLIELGESSPLIIVADVRAIISLPDARGRAAGPGRVRVYIEARGVEALSGVMPVGQELRYLADVPVDARGKPGHWVKRRVILFSRPVAGGNGEIQLVASDAQMPWSAELDARLRGVLGELSGAGLPPRITGISMALYQAGNLAGEGESQIFLNTSTGVPAAIIVVHKAGQPPRWSVSFSEVVDATGRPPAFETLTWYRLACALPASLPAKAILGDTQEAKDHALGDYLMVRRDLGACTRNRQASSNRCGMRICALVAGPRKGPLP